MKSRCIFLFMAVFFSSTLLLAAEPLNTIQFETFKTDTGDQRLRIHLVWEEDPEIVAFNVYSVPSNTLLLVCGKNGISKEKFEQLYKGKDLAGAAAMGIGEVTVELNDYLVEGDHGYRLTKILAEDLSEEQLMQNQVQDFTGIYMVRAGFPGKSM